MKKRILLVLAAAFIAAAALLYLYFTGEGEGAGIPCPIYQLTGLYCSGCGASRALRSVLHFDFYQAIRYNAVFVLVLPFIAVYFSAIAISFIKSGKDAVSGKIPLWPIWIFVAIAVTYGILRNIPFFDFLAPTTL